MLTKVINNNDEYIDDNDDYYSAMKRRADRRRDALRSIMIEGQGIQAESADTAPPEEFVISKDG